MAAGSTGGKLAIFISCHRDLDTVGKYGNANLPPLPAAVNEGRDLITPIPLSLIRKAHRI